MGTFAGSVTSDRAPLVTQTPSAGDHASMPMPVFIGAVDLPGALKGRAYFERYPNGAPAVKVTCTDVGNFETQYATFSLNLGPDASLRPWEFMANTWGENLHLGRTMALSPCFEPVLGVMLKRVDGYEIQTWRMRPSAMEAEARNSIADMMDWPRSIEREPVRPLIEPRVARLATPIDIEEGGDRGRRCAIALTFIRQRPS